MKIPRSYSKLQMFLQDIIQECGVSRSQRIAEAKHFRNYLMHGTNSNVEVILNKCFPHVDMLSSTLFSPVDARFTIDFDYTNNPESTEMAGLAARVLTRDLEKSNSDSKFSEGVFWSCVYGSMFYRDTWAHNGAEPNLVFPTSMGVLREDICDLDRQEAFTITHFLTKSQFMLLVNDHVDKADIVKSVLASAAASRKGDDRQTNLFNQLIISGINDAVTSGTSNPKQAAVMFGNALPTLGPEVLTELIQLDETWVFDFEKEDFVTFFSVNEHVIEGRYRQRNLSGVKGESGIVQICPQPMEGYFWGRVEMASIVPVQDEFNGRSKAYNRVAKMRTNPSQLMTGASGINQTKYDAANRPGGFLSDSTPNAKIQSLAPEMPQEQQYMFQQIDNYFDQAGGFTPQMQGQGVQGVRSDDHAATLTRNGSTRVRRKALTIERQYAEVGNFRLKLLQAKTATTYKTENGVEFRLGDLPGDWRASVDSHSSSPVFAEDNKQLALGLKKLGAIDNATLIRMLHPPMEDEIIDNIKKGEKSNQEMMDKAAKEDPGFWSKLLTGKKK